ncbi:hypothetical protein BJY04DRAFT_196733 [Aspergillus karnatakaensis]|uniref:uncharacterized protein n=1 Tax=Aspergillus karnatakaensis TaxID=1810916 RepID=UPI003CCD0224
MVSPSPTVQVAAGVLKGCTNAIHAAFVHRRLVDDEMLQKVLDGLQTLASRVAATAPFWVIDSQLPVSLDMIKVIDAIMSVLKDCLISLQRFEELVTMQVRDTIGVTSFGARSLDYSLFGWKVNCCSAAVGVVLDMIKVNEDALRQIDVDLFGQQARWYQLAIEQVEDRGKVGEYLIEEIFTISEHMTHLEELNDAVKAYATVGGRKVVEGSQGEESMKQPSFLEMIRSVEAEALEREAAIQWCLEAEKAGAPSDGAYDQPTVPISGPVTLDDFDKMNTADPHCSQSGSALGEPVSDTQKPQLSPVDDAMSVDDAHILPFKPVNMTLPFLPGVRKEPKSLPPIQGEPEEVARIIQLIKAKDYTSAEQKVDQLVFRMPLGAVKYKIALAEAFHSAGKFDRVISLLQISLVTLQSDMTSVRRIDYILARTYFAKGNLSRALDHVSVGLDRTKKQLGLYHASYLQLLELQVQITRAVKLPGKAEELRVEMLPGQSEFLETIDQLEAALRDGEIAKALEVMAALLEELRPKGPTVNMPTDNLIDRLGDSEGWEFYTTVLGFHDDHSLLTILADLDDIDRVMLLCLRGNATVGLPAGRVRPALDWLIRSAALAGQSNRIETLLDLGADIEADCDHILWWRSLGEDHAGMTPLHIATKAAHLDVVKVLIKCGANIEAKNSGGKTALMIADENSQPEIFTFLLENGAKIE